MGTESKFENRPLLAACKVISDERSLSLPITEIYNQTIVIKKTYLIEELHRTTSCKFQDRCESFVSLEKSHHLQIFVAKPKSRKINNNFCLLKIFNSVDKMFYFFICSNKISTKKIQAIRPCPFSFLEVELLQVFCRRFWHVPNQSVHIHF